MESFATTSAELNKTPPLPNQQILSLSHAADDNVSPPMIVTLAVAGLRPHPDVRSRRRADYQSYVRRRRPIHHHLTSPKMPLRLQLHRRPRVDIFLQRHFKTVSRFVGRILDDVAYPLHADRNSAKSSNPMRRGLRLISRRTSAFCTAIPGSLSYV
ncbi:hypothetical protein SprV_0200951600 [Sparganum proliferum]